MSEDNSGIVDVLGDGKLQKQVVKQGLDERPKPGEIVSIHYEWRRLAPDGEGELLDSSRDRGAPFSFELGAQEVIPAWEHGVASMCVGELASFTVHPDLAYGEAGCGGGAVPGDTTLRCDVELLEVSLPDDAQRQLSSEERLQTAMRAKDAGNVHFKSGALEDAARKYVAALKSLEEQGEEDEHAHWQDEVQRETRTKTSLACNLNLAQCELKLSRYTDAFKHADAAMKLEASNSKAIYRRGLAAMHLNLLDIARGDILDAARREPTNAEIRAQLEECNRKCQASQAKERNTFGGMFERGKKAEPLADAEDDVQTSER